MALRLLGADETKTVEFGGTKFTVRKLSHGVALALTRKHTRGGRLDEVAFDREVWLRCLVGWENLADANNVPLSFSREPVKWTDPVSGEERMEPLPFVVAMGLPGDMATVLMVEARGAERKVEEAAKN